MTAKRIAYLRETYERDSYAGGHMLECLDEIVLLKRQLADCQKAIKLAAKGRK